MALENKIGITDSVELARVEEKVSKKRALELFESGYLNSLEALKHLLKYTNIYLSKSMIFPEK